MNIIHPWLFAAALAATAGAASAQDFDNQLNARQGQFRIMALNLGILGNMARGIAEYDADMATMAAENLAAVSSLHQGAMWPEGSDNAALEGTRALPSIWENNADFLSKWEDFGSAAAGVVAVAADGQQALGPAVGALGNTCSACHEAHRQPAD